MAAFENADEEIGDPARILGLLRRLKESRALLSVRVSAEEEEAYNSAILEVRPEAGELLLDEIHPKKGHERFLQSGALRAQALIKGVQVGFAATLKASGIEEGIAYYHVSLPEVVHYGQRRSHYRAQIGLGLTVPVHLVFEDNRTIVTEGVLRDISVGGMSAEVKIDLPADLREGDARPTCIIMLPTGAKVCAGLEVCFAQKDKDPTRLRVGGRFVDLDPAQQKAVERFVAYLDRVVRKKLV